MKYSTSPMLASNYTDKQNPCGYWLSEKYDGVRAIWNGKNLISRNGTIFWAPDWFIQELPKSITLDGELWIDRGQFQDTVGIIRSLEADWSSVKYMVFDIIEDQNIFEIRKAELELMELPSHCHVVEHTICINRDHLNQYELDVLDKKGEGVILRAPGSFYQHDRSQSLFKLKQFRSDEATVVGYTEKGSIVCDYLGKIFNLGSGLSDEIRNNLPKIGSVVTFRFFETTKKGLPRFPSFISVRDYE